MGVRDEMDRIYRDMSLDDIPWNVSTPPVMLVESVGSGKVKPCKAVDLGCGAGNYSVWLAKEGFDVTGLDISEQAIEHARALAGRTGVSARFEAVDLLGDLTRFSGQYDFAFDWEVLHHVFPEDRATYVSNVHSLLRPDGMYFSLCFSERDPGFGGEGKFRTTPLGTTLYFSSEEELRELFEPLFVIDDLHTVEVEGKPVPHLVNAAWLRRK